ncbi:MAG: hypothetical protein MUF59_02345 [Candidatus Krumholzibacteria bacterium]|nr:hypothetical protein [Candidatus Krumholzibacteria bacterium]
MENRPAYFKPLNELGLTDLEAEVYAFLLRDSPATGYRVANTLGKPTANTYKAIQRLFEKGAVMVSDGESRMCRAVPVREFLRTLNKRFEANCGYAEASLMAQGVPPDCDFVYRLRTVEQVFERLRQLLVETEKVAVLDLFPDAVEELKADIESAEKRGVSVLLKLYRPMTVSAGAVVVSADGADVLDAWKGTWANGVFDGGRHLMSLISRDKRHVHYAIWSTNPYVSWVYHCALVQELELASIEAGKDGLESSAGPGMAGWPPGGDRRSIPGFELLQSRLAEYERDASGVADRRIQLKETD